ncbi:unnamed protein product [Haemonchus placei]|uniref:Uncharacterized protein n=1 Tax=Haemonchus placei TaxID=6290 RepID=A0A0N4VZR9_HAEPC|nr:unnamed protein product [Haemonchus placei]
MSDELFQCAKRSTPCDKISTLIQLTNSIVFYTVFFTNCNGKDEY